MPLLDHFHPPLSEHRHWESFHGMWAAEIVASLNRGLLPPGYFAEAQVHIGGVEVDVATLQEPLSPPGYEESNGGVAVQVEAPAITFTMPAVFPDSIAVHVFETSAGPTLVGAIELVSPGNKDRSETRLALASKCAAYLHQGVGLLLVDIVTTRHANLHDELVDLMRLQTNFRFPGSPHTYSVAYRALRVNDGVGRIEVRCASFTLGKRLPRMPLALRGGPAVLMDLEATYEETRVRSQL